MRVIRMASADKGRNRYRDHIGMITTHYKSATLSHACFNQSDPYTPSRFVLGFRVELGRVMVVDRDRGKS